MAIEMGKKYRTRDGRDVRVLCVDAPGLYPVRGYLLPGGQSYSWKDAGNDLATQKESGYDLIEISPYSDIEIDAKGWARSGREWYPRHFAGVNAAGQPTTWIDGKTSHTTDGKASWDEFTTTKPEGAA